MSVTHCILWSFVVVATGVGNAVDELGVQLASLWFHESERYDRLGRILEVVRNVPDRARVLGGRVVVIVELNVGRSQRFGVRHFRLPSAHWAAGGCIAEMCQLTKTHRELGWTRPFWVRCCGGAIPFLGASRRSGGYHSLFRYQHDRGGKIYHSLFGYQWGYHSLFGYQWGYHSLFGYRLVAREQEQLQRRRAA